MTLSRSHGEGEDGPAAAYPPARATALYQAGRYAEAEAEARSVAAARAPLHDDPFGPLALGIAGLAAIAQGHHAEALDTFDALLPDFGRVFGAQHPMTLKLRTDRAQALNLLGRHDACEAECLDVMRTASLSATPETPFIVMAALNGRIAALNALGDHPAVEGLAREFLATPREPDQPTLIVLLSLALSLHAQGRHEEALAAAERAGGVYRGLPPEQRGPETGAVDLAAAAALLGLGRGSEARSRAAAAHDACLAAFGPDNVRTVQARELLERTGGA
ncbi:tetratricopeptide repeat protein [Streptomyces sp. NPDC096136]|uniref:tetratricopeptide repeat protein n=1 Tax=Streptomyces sp. NPDC096136 TaxID=3366076 RepID=UPI0038110A15